MLIIKYDSFPSGRSYKRKTKSDKPETKKQELPLL